MSPCLRGEEVALRPVPPRERLASVLRDRMEAFGIRSQREFAAHLGLGLQKLNRWMQGRGPDPSAGDWRALEAKLPLNGSLSAVREVFRARKRRPRFKGFVHGDGI